MKLLLSCEHGGNEIPQQYRRLFKNATEALESHRGYDPGALDLFFSVRTLGDYSCFSTTSRLLIELNRSLHHPQLFSEFTKQLSAAEQDAIIKQFYLPFRTSAEKKIEEWTKEGEEVLHISIHSFTPVFEGKERNTDIGLLYDPKEPQEKEITGNWKTILNNIAPGLKVRYNYPYLGTADGFTTYLRKKFPKNYSGIEVEVNQKFSDNNEMDADIKSNIKKALEIISKKEDKKI